MPVISNFSSALTIVLVVGGTVEVSLVLYIVLDGVDLDAIASVVILV